METSALLMEGLQLMGLGMGAVFLFLSLLVVAMHLTSRVVRVIDEHQERSIPTTQASAGMAQADSDAVIAIAAAVHRYRHTHKH